MASKYQDDIDDVAETLEEAGGEIILQRVNVTSDDFDPATGMPASIPENIVGVGVIGSFTKPTVTYIGGTSILTGDRKLLFSGPNLKIGDKYGSERVAGINAIAPDDGDYILQICILRK